MSRKPSGLKPPSKIAKPTSSSQSSAATSPTDPGASTDNPDDFIIGDRVWVGGTKPGYIQFIGDTKFAPGEWAGVVLDEPIGKNDGSLGGIRYFMCEPKRGVFSRLTKLTRDGVNSSGSGRVSSPKSSIVSDNEDVQVRRVSSPTNGSVTMTRRALSPTDGVTRTTRQTKRATASPNTGGQVLTSTTTTTVKHDAVPAASGSVRIGDRVLVGGTKAGVLRYMGTTDFATGNWCGVELDEPLGKNDGTVAGKRYFDCKTKYGLFAPIHKVSKQPGSSTVTRVVRTTRVAGNSPASSLHKRSGSRESLGSMSTTSQHSTPGTRVRLGVTSLTSAGQKSGRPQAANVSATNTALQETLREKEQHIDQLLKERDMERSEMARAAVQAEAVTKSSSLVSSTNRNVASTISTSNKFYSYNVVMVIQTIVKVHYMTVFLTFHHLYRPKRFLSRDSHKHIHIPLKGESKKIKNTTRTTTHESSRVEDNKKSNIDSKILKTETKTKTGFERLCKRILRESAENSLVIKRPSSKKLTHNKPVFHWHAEKELKMADESKKSVSDVKRSGTENKNVSGEHKEHLSKELTKGSMALSKETPQKCKLKMKDIRGFSSDSEISDAMAPNHSKQKSKQNIKEVDDASLKTVKGSVVAIVPASKLSAKSSKEHLVRTNQQGKLRAVKPSFVAHKSEIVQSSKVKTTEESEISDRPEDDLKILAQVQKEIYSNATSKPESVKSRNKTENVATENKVGKSFIKESSSSKVEQHVSCLRHRDSDSDSESKTVRFKFNEQSVVNESDSMSETDKGHNVGGLVRKFENISSSEEFSIFEPIKKLDFSNIVQSCRERTNKDTSDDKPEVKFGVRVLPVDAIDGKVHFQSSKSEVYLEKESNSFEEGSNMEKESSKILEKELLTIDGARKNLDRMGRSMGSNNREVEMPDDVTVGTTSSMGSVSLSHRSERLVSLGDKPNRPERSGRTMKPDNREVEMPDDVVTVGTETSHTSSVSSSHRSERLVSAGEKPARQKRKRTGRAMKPDNREVEMPDGVVTVGTEISHTSSASSSRRNERLVSAGEKPARQKPKRTGRAMKPDNTEVEMADDVVTVGMETSHTSSVSSSHTSERLVSAGEKPARQKPKRTGRAMKLDNKEVEIPDEVLSFDTATTGASSVSSPHKSERTRRSMTTKQEVKDKDKIKTSDATDYSSSVALNRNDKMSSARKSHILTGSLMETDERKADIPDGAESLDRIIFETANPPGSNKIVSGLRKSGLRIEQKQKIRKNLDSVGGMKSTKMRKAKAVVSSPQNKFNIAKKNLKKSVNAKAPGRAAAPSTERSNEIVVEKAGQGSHNSHHKAASSSLSMASSAFCSKHTCPEHGAMNITTETIKSTKSQPRKNKIAMESEIESSPLIMRKSKSYKPGKMSPKNKSDKRFVSGKSKSHKSWAACTKTTKFHGTKNNPSSPLRVLHVNGEMPRHQKITKHPQIEGKGSSLLNKDGSKYFGTTETKSYVTSTMDVPDGDLFKLVKLIPRTK